MLWFFIPLGLVLKFDPTIVLQGWPSSVRQCRTGPGVIGSHKATVLGLELVEPYRSLLNNQTDMGRMRALRLFGVSLSLVSLGVFNYWMPLSLLFHFTSPKSFTRYPEFYRISCFDKVCTALMVIVAHGRNRHDKLTPSTEYRQSR